MDDHPFNPRQRPQSAVDTVVDTVRSLLVERRLGPGDLIPSETEIADRLGVSRGSVREAMKVLSAFGVVDVRRGDGTYIATSANRKLFDPLLFSLLVTDRDMEELAELRILMETGIVRIIVSHADEHDLEKLEEAFQGMVHAAAGKSGDAARMLAADVAFHSVMGEITRNRLVQNVYAFVIDLFKPTMHPGQGLETHRRLVDALRARDADAAVAAVLEHDEIWRELNRRAAARGEG